MTAGNRWAAGSIALSLVVHAALLFQRLPGLERGGAVSSAVTRFRFSFAVRPASGVETPRAASAASAAALEPRTTVPFSEPLKRRERTARPEIPAARTNVRPNRDPGRVPKTPSRRATQSSVEASAETESGGQPGTGIQTAAAPEADAGSPVPRSGQAGLESATAAMARVKYEQVLAAWIERHKYYPLIARRRGLQGTSSLKIALRRDGSIATSRLALTSRHEVLDDAALDIVRRSAPFPAVPENVRGDTFEFAVPIRFTLE
jgi:protein TonB